jgi:hypothetical protein
MLDETAEEHARRAERLDDSALERDDAATFGELVTVHMIRAP